MPDIRTSAEAEHFPPKSRASRFLFAFKAFQPLPRSRVTSPKHLSLVHDIAYQLACPLPHTNLMNKISHLFAPAAPYMLRIWSVAALLSFSLFAHAKKFMFAVVTANIVFIPAVVFAAENAPTNHWTPRSPLEYPSSFHSMLASPGGGLFALNGDVGKACIQSIQNHLRSGKNFASEKMDRTFTYKLKESSLAEVRDGVFYHYTKTPNLLEDANRTQNDSLFSWLRSQEQRRPMDKWFLYVAADSKSTRGYGSVRYTMAIDPEAKVFSQDIIDKNASSSASATSSDAIENEIIGLYPGLSICKMGRMPDRRIQPILVLLAAEASGVALISYYGDGAKWYQALGPWSFQLTKEDR